MEKRYIFYQHKHSNLTLESFDLSVLLLLVFYSTRYKMVVVGINHSEKQVDEHAYVCTSLCDMSTHLSNQVVLFLLQFLLPGLIAL